MSGIEVINQEQFEGYREESLMIFYNLMETQAERMDELDDIGIFFKGLRYLVDTKEARIESLQTRNNDHSAVESKAAIGFRKNGLVYLKNNVAYQRVVSHFRNFGKELPVSETTLRKRFNDNGFLVSRSAKTVIQRLFVNAETYQCITFTEDTFKN